MAKKSTALERAAKATQQRLSGDRSSFELITTLGISLGIVGSLLAGWQLFSETQYQTGQHRVMVSAQQVAGQIVRRLKEYDEQVESLVALPELEAALAEDSESDLGNLEAEMRTRIPQAARIRLLTSEGIEQRDPQPFPGLGYAALAVMIDAKTSDARIGPQVGLARTQNAHMNWAQPVSGGQGLLLVSYPMSIVGDLLDQADVGNGYLDFRTQVSGGKFLVVMSRGELWEAHAEELPTYPLAATNFTVGYFQSKPIAYLGTPTTVLLMVMGVSLLLLFGSLVWRFKPGLVSSLFAPKETEEENEEKQATLSEMAQPDENLREAMQFTEDIEADSGGVPKPPATVPQSIFRAYDIRGVVGKTLTAPIACDIGRAIGSEAQDRGVSQIVVARDGRLSGQELVTALTQGLTASGVDVIDIGAVPTGVLYFATHHLGTGSGVMVTGSHNPPDYNGFKIMLAGQTLSGEDIQSLYQRILERRLIEGSGGVQEMDILQEYVDRIAGDVQVEEPLKVVVDCGNGIGGRVAPQVMEEIGCEVVPLFCEVDGTFPNHHPDPSDPANLQDLIMSVKQLDADLGVALDGDGDRLGVVTKDGEIIFPDRLLMLYAKDVLTRNPGAAVIYDVKCTGQLARVVLQHGGSPIMWKTGHSFIKKKMQETNAALAGEMSGHFFFQERWYGFDDGIYSCARLLEILAAEGQPPQDTLNALPNSVSTPEIKVEMNEGEHFAFIKAFKEKAEFEGARITDIDGIRADYDDGWGLVRCSNTTPCLVLRFDANSPEALQRIQATFKEQILGVRKDLELPF